MCSPIRFTRPGLKKICSGSLLNRFLNSFFISAIIGKIRYFDRMENAGQFCFTHPSGKDICLFTLRNDNGTEVLITNYGAILMAYKIHMPDGSMNDIVLGFD